MSGEQAAAIDGFLIHTDAKDSLGLRQTGIFEPEVLNALRSLVLPDDVVMDIGANIGYFTAHLSRLVPAGKVHAFEPEPENYALLQANVQVNRLSNVICHQVALGSGAGEATLQLSDFSGGMHRLYQSVCCTGGEITVPVCALDDLFSPSEVSFIKIDIEGYEPQAFSGARRIIQQQPRLRILTEYCPASIMEAGSSPVQLIEDLTRWGLKPFELDGRPLDAGVLMEDAGRYQNYGAQRLVASCAGKSNPEIADTVRQLAESLGCKRPFIENLIFRR